MTYDYKCSKCSAPRTINDLIAENIGKCTLFLGIFTACLGVGIHYGTIPSVLTAIGVGLILGTAAYAIVRYG